MVHINELLTMIPRTHTMLFALILITFSGHCQLDSLEGFWLRTEQSDTTILKIHEIKAKKRRNNSLVRKAFQISTNRKYQGIYYYTFADDSLCIVDAYGNVLCKTLNYNIGVYNWEINDECQFSYSRITKAQFDKLIESIETKKASNGGSEDINKTDEKLE